MKKLTLTTISLLIAGLVFSEEEKQKQLIIGKLVPGKSVVDPNEKLPEGDVKKPKRPLHRSFPLHWGKPPAVQTRDIRPLPGGFGMGSSTLANWIKDNIKKDIDKGKEPIKPKPQPRPEPPIELKEKMDSYKETQQSLQTGLREKIKALGKKPSRDEVRKTVEQFRTDNKDLIESQKEIGKSIQDWQKKPEPSAEVKEKLQQVRETQKELDVVKKVFHEKLKNSKELSKEQRVGLIKEFKQANADKHKAVKEAQKELQKEIRSKIQSGDRRE
jgi:hypothetical protein